MNWPYQERPLQAASAATSVLSLPTGAKTLPQARATLIGIRTEPRYLAPAESWYQPLSSILIETLPETRLDSSCFFSTTYDFLIETQTSYWRICDHLSQGAKSA